MGIRDQVLMIRGYRADPDQELGIMDQGFKHYGSQGLSIRGRELGTRDQIPMTWSAERTWDYRP